MAILRINHWWQEILFHFCQPPEVQRWRSVRIFYPKKSKDLCFRERIRIQLFLRSLNSGEGGVSYNWTGLRTRIFLGYPLKVLPLPMLNINVDYALKGSKLYFFVNMPPQRRSKIFVRYTWNHYCFIGVASWCTSGRNLLHRKQPPGSLSHNL